MAKTRWVLRRGQLRAHRHIGAARMPRSVLLRLAVAAVGEIVLAPPTSILLAVFVATTPLTCQAQTQDTTTPRIRPDDFRSEKTSMKEAILSALTKANARIPDGFIGPYLDVTTEFRDAVTESSSLQGLLDGLAELNGRPKIDVERANFKKDSVTYLGILHPKLSQLPIKNSRYGDSYELTLNIIYLGEDKYRLTKALITNQRAYP